jgi:hypothetical protein
MRKTMIRRLAMRTPNRDDAAARKLAAAFTRAASGIVIIVSVISASIIAAGFGSSTAAGNSSPKVAEATPVSLAGRWIGHYYGYGRRGDGGGCGDDGCALTYDIVACKEGWCGIAVKDGKTCGAVGVHLTADATQGENAFKGKLELAKGAAAYAVEAFYRIDKASNAVDLHFLGDTGPELLMFRRSYPFEATLARAGDTTCTLGKATS